MLSVARQISREEFMARFGGGERPQPLNTPGLPAADAARAKAELEILQDMAEAAGGRKKGDRQIKRVRGKETRYSKGVGRAESGEEVFGERDLINQRRAAIEMQRQEQMLAMEQNRALAEAGVAPLTQVQDVVNAATGANLDPETAMRVAQLSEALQVDASTALQVLAAEQQKMRSIDDPRAKQMLAEVSKRSEVPLEAAGSLDAARDTVDAVEAQLAERVLDELAPQTRALSEMERREIAAQLGIGRKSRSTGKKNPLEKASGEQPPDPYLVPVLLAKAVQEGEFRQPPTVGPEYRKQFDADAVRLGLLDPSAPLDYDVASELGLMRPALKDGKIMGSKVENVPTIDPSAGEGVGFRPEDDPSIQRDLVPMTLGQAVNAIVEENRTPLVVRPEGGVYEDPSGATRATGTGQKVFYRGDYGGMDNYRVGVDSQYKLQMYEDLRNLIERQTGMQLIANTRLKDPAMERIQRAMLARAIPESDMRIKGPQNPKAAQKAFPGKQVAVSDVRGDSPMFDIINQLRAGRNIPPSDVSQESILASTQGPEGQFYRELVGRQIADQRQKTRAIKADAARNAAVNAAGSAIPAKAAPISDTYDLSNAPAPQQAPQNKDQNMAQTMIGNVLRSLGL